jgi:hypothetical protein
MPLSLQTLAKYLECPASTLLRDAPFRDWPVEKSFENDLEEPLIQYIFPSHGVELLCDEFDNIGTIFLHCDASPCIADDLIDLSLKSTREQMLDVFGTPSKSGAPRHDPILGDYGPWDRFAKPGYAIRIGYHPTADRIHRITLMREDFVP